MFESCLIATSSSGLEVFYDITVYYPPGVSEFTLPVVGMTFLH